MSESAGALWRTERATRLSVIVDADDYFSIARAAMLKARHRIMLIGWDFDARIRLVRDGRDRGEPAQVGDFIYWLVERNAALDVYLLRWDVGALRSLARGMTLMTVLKWLRHPRIHTKLDGFHPIGASHHQKIVVIDDCFALCGGIDVTSERWDTRAHADDDPGRRGRRGKPYKPWHDATTALQGPAAAALGELGRDRWARAGAGRLEAIAGASDCWPDALVPDFTDVAVGIARTRPPMRDCPEVREIERLFLAQIAAARRHIYAESQYFASRRIAEAIARRLDEADGPEIVIVNPETAQGWLEPLAMDSARARLMAALVKRDVHGRLRLYHPYTAAGAPIYVHAKVMIVDGTSLRIGSANMNNRSLGLDTECDVTIEATGADAAAVARAIGAVRDGLIGEHLGVPAARIAAELAARGSLIATIEALRGEGRSLRPYRMPALTGVEAWLADNEVLDPETPGEMFEATTKRGLFRRRMRQPRR